MYKKIMAPLDGSELAESTLHHVREIAKGLNVPTVDVVVVLESIREAVWDTGDVVMPPGTTTEARARYEVGAKEYVAMIEKGLKEEGIAAKGVVLEGGPVAEKLLRYAEKNNVDLIVMSTHGRSGPSRWAFGSVTERVIRHATMPVLVITPKGSRT